MINRRITSPYLTVEFKKDETEEIVAECKEAAASSLALYNRFCLREKALKVSGKIRTTRKTNVLRHYGLTMKGSTYTVFVSEPRLTKDYMWAGCQMTKLCRGDLDIPASVRDFIDWMNEIHCWGLTIHGPKCEEDVKVCINPRESRIRTSEIAPDSEDGSNREELSHDT